LPDWKIPTFRIVKKVYSHYEKLSISHSFLFDNKSNQSHHILLGNPIVTISTIFDSVLLRDSGLMNSTPRHGKLWNVDFRSEYFAAFRYTKLF
jgi:hypothetical protein